LAGTDKMGSREGFTGQNIAREEEEAMVRYVEAVSARGRVAIGYVRGY
jgi:hypothetical protein